MMIVISDVIVFSGISANLHVPFPQSQAQEEKLHLLIFVHYNIGVSFTTFLTYAIRFPTYVHLVRICFKSGKQNGCTTASHMSKYTFSCCESIRIPIRTGPHKYSVPLLMVSITR